MRKALILFAIIAQVVVLAKIVWGRESVVQNGERIFLRTAPIDPRDPFRGDFVRLRYPMNSLATVQSSWTDENESLKKGDLVYAVLSPSAESVHKVDKVTQDKPDNGLFIKGRVSRSFSGGLRDDFRLRTEIKFGIEQMYIEQGAGIDIENKQGLRGGLQVPLEVEVAVGTSGTAVITGLQWSPLGIDMQFPQPAAANPTTVDAETPPENLLRIRLENVSAEPISLNNPGNNCGFSVEPARIFISAYKAATQECEASMPENVVQLNPGESFNLAVNLAEPRWHIQQGDNPSIDLREVGTAETFRIVYRAPANTQTASNVWMGELPSRGFSPRGRLD